MTTTKMARTPASRQLLALLLILFAGCGNMPEKDVKQVKTPDLYEQARDYESHGNLLGAAQDYQQLAERQTSPAREGHLLEAANLFSRGHYSDRARAVIATLDSKHLTTDQNLRLRLIQARIAMDEKQPKAALKQLQLPTAITLPADLQQEWRAIKAEASAQTTSHPESARPSPINTTASVAISTGQAAIGKRPNNIALLLPLSGSFSGQATAVREGFLAANYARGNGDYNPTIRVYDTTDNADTGMTIYQQALNEGADFIVGPLHKPLLERITANGKIPVPMLALNYLSDENAAVNNLYQYGLLPEDEARQVAERAALDGHTKALALIPTGEWGDRMLATFSKEWQQRNGRLLEVQRYDASLHDFTEPVVKLLNVDNSRARYNALKSALGMDIKFDGRRRQDADFVFVAAFPNQARQISPQLRFFFAGDLPVYSTSHTFGGEINANQDRDLEGVIFCDMPWTLTNGEGHKPSWEDFINTWKASAIPFKRLYAMGIDAYRLMEQFDKVGNDPQNGLSAESGSLYRDAANRIHRQLQWARFRNGKPVVIESAPATQPTSQQTPS